MKTCIFCLKTSLTREHIYPKWLFKSYSPEKKSFSPQIQVFELSKDNLEADKLKELVSMGRNVNYDDFVLKGVCEECNGGWMSALERNVSQIFEEYTLLTEPNLDISSKNASFLSQWAIMKIILASFTTKNNKIDLPKQFFQLLSEGIIPEGFMVEIATTMSNNLNFAIGGAALRKSFDISREELDFACEDYIQASLQIGRVAFRITFLRTAIPVFRKQMQIKMLVLYPYKSKIRFQENDELANMLNDLSDNMELPLINSFMAVID